MNIREQAKHLSHALEALDGETTPEVQARIARDQIRMKEKWGRR